MCGSYKTNDEIEREVFRDRIAATKAHRAEKDAQTQKDVELVKAEIRANAILVNPQF